MSSTGERLRVWRGDNGTVRAIPPNVTKRTFFLAWKRDLLPGVAVELAVFGDAWNKINVYHCPGRLARFGGVAYGVLSALDGCGKLCKH